ncbi:DUF4817 domain-containing protein [Trichonephila clavipes]|nr:DUF4817 domain-containing protein [Trichonephila clavipes]
MPGRPRTITAPEDVAGVRASIEQCPKRLALKLAAALKLSDRGNIPPGAVWISSDEAPFHLSGPTNKQNFGYRAAEKPQPLHQSPLHSPRVTVWYAVAEFIVRGPYFFEDKLSLTVCSYSFCHMIETFLRPKLNQFLGDHEEAEVWFQQDGATAHTSWRSLGILRDLFSGRLLSLRGDIAWLPRSPDLSSCDFLV